MMLSHHSTDGATNLTTAEDLSKPKRVKIEPVRESSRSRNIGIIIIDYSGINV